MKNHIVFLLCIIITFSCESGKKGDALKHPAEIVSLDQSAFELKAGDILFQDSDCGPFCESIEKVTSGFQGSKFSHVGLVTKKDPGTFMVLEAITDGVVETPLNEFLERSFDEDNNSKVVVGRMKPEHEHLIPKAIQFAYTKLGFDYDEVFDISNNTYYCSELIYDAFLHANNDRPVFQLQSMTFKDPDTEKTFPIWENYFKTLNTEIPEGKPGLNPGGMSKSSYINIVHFYGKPDGYKEN